MDEASQAIIKELVSNIEVDGKKFRAWGIGERSRYIPVTIKIPASIPQGSFSARKVHQVLLMQNGLQEGASTIRSCLPVFKGSKERLLKLGVEKDLVATIVQRGGRLYLGEGSVDVHHGGSIISESNPKF